MIRVNLALQGGGAHGAFTWGVLDRLLEEEEIGIAEISATSAGALNAVALKAGWVAGGRDGARQALARLWDAVSGQTGLVGEELRGWFAPFAPPLAMIEAFASANPAYQMAKSVTGALSPYEAGLGHNPLQTLLDTIDWDAIRAEEGPKLHVAATNVRSGKIRVFAGAKITGDAVLASACLPTLFRAVEIDGEAYWDGGYMGNPALFPLYGSDSADVIIVHINPILRPEVPRSAEEIANRINEISFNATLLREMRAIDFVARLMDEGRLPEDQFRRLNIHSIADDATMVQLGVATKVSPSPALVLRLFEAGQTAMSGFLEAHRDSLGQRSSCDLRAMFQ